MISSDSVYYGNMSEDKKIKRASPRKKSTVKPTKRKATATRRTRPRTVSHTILPKTILPIPLPVAADTIPAGHKHRTSPQRWSLRHNVFTIAVLTLVGALALAVVAGQADATFQMIAAYGTISTTLIHPVPKTERAFPITAGNLTMQFPQRWQVLDAAQDTIHWQLTDDPTYTVTLTVHPNDQANIFTWLQQQQPTYRNAHVVTPTEAVEALRGLMVEADGDNATLMHVVYFPHQKNLAEKYVVELMLTAPADDPFTQRSMTDFNVFVNNLRLE